MQKDITHGIKDEVRELRNEVSRVRRNMSYEETKEYIQTVMVEGVYGD